MALRLSLLGSLPLICSLAVSAGASAAETIPTSQMPLPAAAVPEPVTSPQPQAPVAAVPTTTLPTASPALKPQPQPAPGSLTPPDAVDRKLLQDLQANPNPLQLPNEPKQVQIKTVQPITLKEAIELARQNNPTLQVRQLELDQARAAQREVFAQFLPTLGLTGNVGYQQTGTRQFLDGSNSPLAPSTNSANFTTIGTTNLTGAVNFAYTLFNFTRGATYAAATAEVKRAELAYETAFEDLKQQVADTYYQLQSADQQTRIFNDSVKASLVSLKDAQALFKAGVGTQFDVLRQQVQLATDQQNLVNALGRQDKGRRDLAALLNIPQNVNLLAADPVELVAIWKPTLEESIIQAFSNRAELQSLLLQKEASDNRAQAAIGAILPSLGLNASTGSTFQNVTNQISGSSPSAFFQNPTINNNGYNFSVGLQLNVPLYDGGAAEARARRENLNARIAEQNFTNTRNQIRQRVEQQFYDLQSSLTNVGVTKLAVEQSKEALRLARLRFQAGVGTQTDVIETQRDLTRQEGLRLDAIISYNRAYAALVRQVSNYPAVSYPQ